MVPATRGQVRAALDRSGRLGGFFRLPEVPEPPEGPEPPSGAAGWRPVADLYAGGEALAALVTTAAQRLGTGERRAAASILHQGFAARLWSVTIGPALLCGVLPTPGPDELHWRSTPDALLEFAVAGAGGWSLWTAPDPPEPAPSPEPPSPEPPSPEPPSPEPPVGAVAELLHRAVLDRHLAALALRLRAESVSARILTGNAVSALFGTLRVMPPRPATGAPWRATAALAAALLDRAGLRAAGTTGPGALDFRRASCCLYYRVPGGGLCGDCVLRPPRPAD